MTDGIILLFLRTMYTVLENPKKFLLLFFLLQVTFPLQDFVFSPLIFY